MNSPRRALGLDIGGTKIVAAAVDAAGRIHARHAYPTESARGFATGLAQMRTALSRVLAEAGWPAGSLTGIGIGCAGPVNPQRGTIHNPFTLPGWDDADIVTPLREAFNTRVRLENDADAAAVGEYLFGAGAHASPLVMITLGTGVGGAILVNGEIYRGVNGEHPELGHVPVGPDGPECYCGRRGCWESLAAGPAIAAAGRPLGFTDSRAVFLAATLDANAAAIVQRAVDATATATWTLLHTCLPQRIVLGGGIGEEHFDRFAAAMREQVARATQVPKAGIEIVKAARGNDAGVLGAAGLMLIE
jgi:glucokinase